MIRSKQQQKLASIANWASSLAVAVLLCVALPSHAAESVQANPKSNQSAGNQITVLPRVAQNTSASPYSKILGLLTPESLPTPNPEPATRAQPGQHIIPFSKPDPDADIVVKESEGLISLMVRDASLKQVIAMIAETQKLNIVFAAPADTGITASLDRIPWQQALDSLLSASGHTWASSDGIIYVTSLGTANFMSPQAGGQQTRIFELDFASAVDVDQTIKGLLSPGGQSWIQESSTTDNRRTREVVVAFDFPAHLERIAQYVCQIDQPPRQVMIEANILQVDLDETCKNGINFDALASFSGNTINFKTLGFANPASTSAFFLEVDGSALDGLVELLQTTSDAKTLASPRLLVVSGQQARIQIGEQLGYRVTTTTQTSTLESVEFLNVGVVLSVTPRITRDGRVLMEIKPKVSKGSVNPATGLPEEETTEVETDILLRDGHGMVVGGLIQEQDSITESKLPWLGDLPYAGVLFQKRESIKTRSEIIVTLTPHVQPYLPMVAEREEQELMRAEQPLTTGAINRAYRPYEPRLYDALTNPRPILPARLAKRLAPGSIITSESGITPQPSVKACPTCPPTISEPEVAKSPTLQNGNYIYITDEE